MACTIKYNGKDYSYEEFAAMLNSGLLNKFVSDGIVSDKSFIGKPKDQFKKRDSEFDKYREKILGKDIESEQSILDFIEDVEDREDLSDEDVDLIEGAKQAIYDELAADKKAYEKWKKAGETLDGIKDEEDLTGLSLEQLIEVYNLAEQRGDSSKEIKSMIGDYLHQTRMADLEKRFPEEAKEVNSKDMTWVNRWFKALTDVSHKFPAIQELAKHFNRQYHKKIEESNRKKKELEKLAKAVIKEYNQNILGKASDLIRTDSAKYFDFVDDGGKLRTNTAGLSKAQKDYLAFMSDLVKDRKQIFDEDENLIDNTLIMTDPGFQETFRTEGWKAALKLAFTPSKSQNRVNYKGALTSRFGRPYKGKTYSKDFYKAAQDYIDDYYHIKYMSEFVPIVEGIEQFYKRMGIEEGKDFTNTLEFLKNWKQGKIYQEPGVTDPRLDATLRFLRKLTSQTVMAFNVPANVLNVAIGNYNAWRADGIKHITKGQTRLFGGGREFNKEHGYGVISKKAIDVLKKYDVVNTDLDSYPLSNIGGIFDKIAHAGTRWGEVQIQGSQFLGQLTDNEYKAFSYDKDGNLTVDPSKAGMTEKEFEDKMYQYKNHVADVQGKYSEKDRRNYLNYEHGKFLSQFKTWMPDWWRTRFGEEFVDAYGNKQGGSWTFLTKKGMQELKTDLMNNTLFGDKKSESTKKALMSLRGAMVVASLLIYVYGDDDDEDKDKYKTLSVENGLSQVLSIFDPHQLKWMIQNPSAGTGTILKFYNALEDLVKMDGKKFTKDAKKLVPYNKVYDIVQAITE